MTLKPDPYATKTQKRVDLFLIAIILVAIFFLLRPTAHGDDLVSKLANRSPVRVLSKTPERIHEIRTSLDVLR